MKKEFKGRNVVAGTVQAQSVVSRKGMNTLATFQKSILAKRKQYLEAIRIMRICIKKR